MVASTQDISPESLLDYSEELVGLLFNGVPMGVAIVDRDFVLQQFNPTWANFISRYTNSSLRQVVPGANFLALAPGIEGEIIPLFQEVLGGKTLKREALRLESEGITSYWDLLLAPLVKDGRIMAVVIMTTDATERVQAYETLARTVEKRTGEAEKRQHVAEGLRDLVTMLNSVRPLQEVLHYILAEACRLLGAGSGAIFRASDGDSTLRVQVAHGLPANYVASMTVPQEQGAVGHAISTRQPVIVRDIRDFLDTGALGLDPQKHALLEGLTGQYSALLALPIFVKEEVYGGFVLYYPHSGPQIAHHPREFSIEEIGLAVTIGDHISLAVGNDRLRSQVEQAARASERNRLARDLHDSVTQTLFSASIIAEVLPNLCMKDHKEGEKRLRELRGLTRGALAEMRTLLLELRPASLTEIPLGDLLKQLVEGIAGRVVSSNGLLPIELEVTGHGTLPPDTQVALYRIAQEALNNLARHSQATHAKVSLHIGLSDVELRIGDDGRGFDPTHITPEHLGLSIMRERAASIGAKLDMKSQKGKGTEIAVIWNAHEKA